MHTWVYYIDGDQDAAFMLYRVKEDLNDPTRRERQDPQVYHRKRGWIPDEELVTKMNRAGFLGQDDSISEEKALALIAGLQAKAP